jgi:hypothetical protein
MGLCYTPLTITSYVTISQTQIRGGLHLFSNSNHNIVEGNTANSNKGGIHLGSSYVEEDFMMHGTGCNNNRIENNVASNPNFREKILITCLYSFQLPLSLLQKSITWSKSNRLFKSFFSLL